MAFDCLKAGKSGILCSQRKNFVKVFSICSNVVLKIVYGLHIYICIIFLTKNLFSLHSPIDLPHYAKTFDITNRRITPKDAEVVDEVEFFVTARFFTSSAVKFTVITAGFPIPSLFTALVRNVYVSDLST